MTELNNLRRYAENRLPRRFKETGLADFELPVHGKKSEVALLTFNSGKRAVLRAFDSRSKFITYVAAMRFGNRRKLPIPQLILTDQNPLSRLRFGRWFAVEELVAGEPLIDSQKSAAQLKAAVQAVADLHSETSTQWGRVRRLKRKPFLPHFQRRADTTLDELALDPQGPGEDEISAWRQWFHAKIATMSEPPTFSFVHHHLAADDILVSANGEQATILDNATLRFDCFVQDVEDLADSFEKIGAAKRPEVIALYLQCQTHLPANVPYEITSLLYRVERRLKRLRRILRRLKSGKLSDRVLLQQETEAIRQLLN